MTKTVQRFPVIFATGLTAALFALPASAIPSLARTYETSCQTCQEQIKQKPVSLGAVAYERTTAIYPSDVPGNVPIAPNVKMASGDSSSIDDTGRQITHSTNLRFAFEEVK